MEVAQETLEAFRAHVLARYPEEACGVLVDGRFLPCQNVSDNPRLHFQIRSEEMVRIAMEVGPVQAILHSHPFDSRRPPKWPAHWPSHNDMAQWMKGSVPWGITGTEGENIDPLVWLDEGTIAPLEGREFVHGVWDCYATVRDWYRVEKGLTIPNFPRGMDWWDRGANHYEENFERAGFKEIHRDEVDVGDAMLIRVRAPVPNHAAVITGNNQILHHLFHRLSGFDRFDRWERFAAKFVRYTGAPNA
jgi:proteasome lid subunit RPN8/RPN11